MKKQLLSLMAFCAACFVLGAQAQSSSGGGSSDTTGSSSGTSSGSSSSSMGGSSDSSSSGAMSGSAGSESGWMSRHMGQMGHHEVKASQLTGAQVNDSSGSQLGTLSDTIINPMSGRIDFAILSLSSAGGTSGATGGKQVAVPWMLLRPASTAGASTSTGQQPTFTFAGDSSKLQSAPSFDPNADLNQPSWRQSVFSYFGLTGGAGTATGASEAPGGGTSGSSTTNSSSMPSPSSSGGQ